MSQPGKEFNLTDYIMHHVQNRTSWDLPFVSPINIPQVLTLHGLMIILAAFFLVLMMCVFYRKDQKVPTGFTNMIESFVVFIRDKIAINNLGDEDGRRFTPFFCTLFFFILILNLMGKIPIFASATGNINVTAALALIIFSFMTLGAIKRNGIVAYCRSFVIPGLPWPMLILVVPLEILGIFTRTFALAIRLFANMIAGHMIAIAFLGLVALFGWFMTPPALLFAVFIGLLEILVVFLQAYIFTLLSAVFIGQMYHPSH